MSLFQLSKQDDLDQAEWLSSIKSFNSLQIEAKSSTYSFNFQTGKPIPSNKLNWEEANKFEKRLSNPGASCILFSRNSVEEEQTCETIPIIRDSDLRASCNYFATI